MDASGLKERYEGILSPAVEISVAKSCYKRMIFT